MNDYDNYFEVIMVNEWSYDLSVENQDEYSACFEFVLNKLEQNKIDEIIERVDNYFDAQGLSDIQENYLESDKNSDKTVIVVFWNLLSDFYDEAREESGQRGKEIEYYINSLCR